MAKDLYVVVGRFTVFIVVLNSTLKNDGYVVHFDPSCAATFRPGYNRVDTVYVCSGTSYTFPNGEVRVIDRPTIQTSHFTPGGTDSTVITCVKIAEQFDLTLSITGDEITAGMVQGNFQWLDCDQGYEIIPGATGPSFTPVATGHYAVALSGETCADTSTCIYFIVTGNNPVERQEPVYYYPNPTSDIVHVNLGEKQDAITYIVTDLHGQVIERHQLYGTALFTVRLPVIPGVYFLRMTLDDGDSAVIRVIRL
jgi:hypothetical protein